MQKEVYYHGNRKEKKIALTFDDGPSNNTEEILKLLKKHQSKATFFILGKRIKGNEKIIKKIINEGCEIGNHSFTHWPMLFSKRKILEDFKRTDLELKKLKVKTNLVRFPYINLRLYRRNVPLTGKIISADIDSFDFLRVLTSRNIIKRIIHRVRGGSIIILHDSFNLNKKNSSVIKIIRELLPLLKKSGYKLVTVSELLK